MDIVFRFKTDDPRHMDAEDINLAFFRTVDGRTVGIDRRHTIWNCTDSGEVLMIWSYPYLWEVDGCIPFDDEDDSSAVLPDRLMRVLLDGAKFLYFSLKV